jgi:hypothetical protein
MQKLVRGTTELGEKGTGGYWRSIFTCQLKCGILDDKHPNNDEHRSFVIDSTKLRG